MIVILKKSAEKQQVELFDSWLHSMGLETHKSVGANHTIVGLVGDTSRVDIESILALDIVETVKRIQEPYKNANRKFHEEDTVITLSSGAKIGGGHFLVMAGPCSVETEEQIISVAESVKAAGAQVLRGGAFKPRTSPYAFQGLHEEGIRLLQKARAATGLPIVTEIMDAKHLPLFEDIDIIQVGARNMQNFELLKELGKLRKPVLIKRGMANTLQELLMSAEYVMAGGNEQVILCERGIRTFETYTRNTLDLSAVLAVKRQSHLPVVVDPSHAAGMYWMVEPLAMAAVAVGADGLMVEVHNDPPCAKCDGAQSLTPEKFRHLMGKLNPLIELMGKKLV